MITMALKTYLELINIPDFFERIQYLQTYNVVGQETFGGQRWLNQVFYKSYEWDAIRRKVIVRDKGLDLGMEGHPIVGPIIVHHINPLSPEDIMEKKYCLVDLNNLICVSQRTHNMITYGCSMDKIQIDFVERRKGDTCLWK